MHIAFARPEYLRREDVPAEAIAQEQETIAAIALQAFVVTYVGILIGKRLGAKLGRKTSRIAGLVAAAAFGVLGAYLVAQRFFPWLPEL